MPVSSFGVVLADVQARFGTQSLATYSVMIAEWITQGGARVSTIVQEAPGIDPSDVPTDEPLYHLCRSYVVAYASRIVAQMMTRQNPEIAVAYEKELEGIEKTIRKSTVGAMGDSFDRSEHIGTFRGGKARGGGGGRIVKGSHRWDSKTRM